MTIDVEKQLVSQILTGNEKALRVFYRTYAPKLLNFVKKMSPSHEDAEEILQDTLVSSLDALRDFTFSSTLSTFLHSIAKHKTIDHLRKKKIKKIFLSQAPQLESMLVSLLSPENLYYQKEHTRVFEAALNSLTPLYKKILLLKYIEGKTVKQIKNELSISFKSAESMLFRARRAFAKAFTLLYTV